jgi:carbon monoxide dehydrogenase subunit G
MTTYTGPEVVIEKSTEYLKSHFNDFSNFEAIFPESTTYFKAYEEGFTFQMGSMPKVGLQKAESDNPNEIALKAAGGSIDFKLICRINPISDNQSKVQLHFEGEFNPMIRMMVEKPLKRLIDDLSEGLKGL